MSVEVSEATAEEAVQIARNLLRRAAEADSLWHMFAEVESALIWMRGATEDVPSPGATCGRCGGDQDVCGHTQPYDGWH